MDPGALRNFKDFLQLYNKMTEMCFQICVDNIGSRRLDPHELTCVEACSQKFINYNNKLMQHFVKAQEEILNRRMQEVEKQQALNADQSNLELQRTGST